MDSGLPKWLFRAGLEPNGEKVNTYSVMTHLRDLLAILKPYEIDVFKKNGFEKLFELAEKPIWSSRFGFFLLRRQIEVSNKTEIWVLFGGKPVRLSLREFKLVTALKCGKVDNLNTKDSTPYYYTMFGRHENMTVKKGTNASHLQAALDLAASFASLQVH
ncbi:unnamed protein product [Brassica rapa]|uniref:DUF1985 domain-containing protein n=2 Tax=Brassica TaxID=3705 RepID=A0A8D9H8L0_BRACM|nr:unnamed protein product [Brassica napus]CAG7894407.1 unnamed protein product [Brassica rapa]